MKKLIYILFFICSYVYAKAYTIETVPNPKTSYSDAFVSNPDGLLSAQSVDNINRKAADLKNQVEVELAVVAINGMDGDYIENFANQLFNYWGIGGKDNSQGVLILLDVDSRDVRIEVGDGCEGLLPDVVCNDIIQETMIPYLADNQYSEGLVAGVDEIYDLLTTDEAKTELLIGYRRQEPSLLYYLSLYLMLGFIVLLGLDIIIAVILFRKSNLPNNQRYEQAKRYYHVFVFLGMLFVFPVALLVRWYRRQGLKSIRYAPMKCKKCGHQMHVLTEAQEDMFLQMSQIAEERVGSVDYDVWECPECKNHEVLPYYSSTTTYTRCPHCGAQTYNLQSDRIIAEPTQFRNGRGLRQYVCANCGHHLDQSYVIPKIIMVSGGSSRGGFGSSGSGGGFSGGSWGGGHSSGGGATGHF